MPKFFRKFARKRMAMDLLIKKSKVEDIKQLMKIYEQAILYMRRCGNMNQWNNGYPSESIIISDINNAVSYSVLQGEKIVGVFSMIPGEDPTYKVIEGKWINTGIPYVTIHRIASDGSCGGIGRTAFDFAKRYYDSIRIDTHKDNVKMQDLVISYGFKYCGIIYLQSGEPRLAYQYIKDEK